MNIMGKECNHQIQNDYFPSWYFEQSSENFVVPSTEEEYDFVLFMVQQRLGKLFGNVQCTLEDKQAFGLQRSTRKQSNNEKLCWWWLNQI